MKRTGFPIRLMSMLGVVALLALMVAGPVQVASDEPTPRPTPGDIPFIRLDPDQGVQGNDNRTRVTGYLFTYEVPVAFFFDGAGPMQVLEGVTWNSGDGTFTALLQIPLEALAGMHVITARQQGGLEASAQYEIVLPTPTNTPSPTDTLTPTRTRKPTSTYTPTLSPTPTPTLRPITPMVTITPIPPTKPPSQATVPPVPTRTNTPLPGTATSTYTPSVAPTPSNTPGPGTPSATPLPTALPSATPVEEISETGGGWGTVFLWGFVLAGLLVVFRLLRVTALRRG
jgi:hypothetical protein